MIVKIFKENIEKLSRLEYDVKIRLNNWNGLDVGGIFVSGDSMVILDVDDIKKFPEDLFSAPSDSSEYARMAGNAAEILNVLDEADGNLRVKMNSQYGCEVLFILRRADVTWKDVAWLEGEDDCDMALEIDARFNVAAEKQLDELDFYMDMLDSGITVEMVRKYAGDERADLMKKFCEEHGLI